MAISVAAADDRARTTVGLCFLAAFAEGFDIQSMGVAAPTMAPALHLAREQLGPVFSASTLGLLVGAVALGRLADRIGRRWTLIASLAIFGVFSLATVLAWDFQSLLAIRLCAGLGLGGAMPNLIALASEAVAETRRARFVALAAAALPMGGAIASAVAAGLDWRAIFEVGGAAPLAVAALMLPALPESERFLAARSGAEAGGGPAPDLAGALFGGGRALSTLLLWTAGFAMLLSLFLLLNWLPTLMSARGISKPGAALISMMFNVGGGAGGLAIAAFITGRGRSATLAVLFAGMTGAVVALALAGPGLAPGLAAGLAVGFFVPSGPAALYALTPDYYPVPMRSTGLGAVIGVGRLGAILGPFLAAALLSGGADTRGVLLALLPFFALAAAATFTVLTRRTPSPSWGGTDGEAVRVGESDAPTTL